MEVAELKIIISQYQALAAEVAVKRNDFQKRGMTALFEQCMGESLAIGKCLSILQALHPDEHAQAISELESGQ